MPRNNPRYVVGAQVQAKAHHVTALAECHQQYGANAKTKFVNGTVVSVDAAASSGGRRAATLITADYNLGGGTIKRCQLSSRGIKIADAELTTGMSKNEPVTTLVNENVEHVNDTINVGAPSVAGMTTQEMLDAIQSLDEEPEQAQASVETTTAAAAIAANNLSTVAIVHHVEWRRASSTEPLFSGNHTPRMWSERNVVGENLYRGQPNSAINSMSAMDFFLLMFPPKQLVAMIDLTNIELEKLEANTTYTSELLKFFGVLILMTSLELTSRASL
jgi:hypothetical protein